MIKSYLPSTFRQLRAILPALLFSCLALHADDASAANTPAPKPLIDFSTADAAAQVKPNFGQPVYTLDKTGISVQLPAGKGNYAGIQVYPPGGAASWDLTPYGHIEAKITNTGTTTIRFTIVAKSVAQGQPAQNAEVIGIKPGESKIAKIIFGYMFGFHPGPMIEQGSVNQIILYVDKTTVDQSFRVEDLQAAGATGEKPPFNPDYVVTVPPNGVILGQGATFDPAKQTSGLPVTAGPDGAFDVTFAGGKVETLKIKPAMGVWNLNQANEIRVKFKNVGDTPATPSVNVGPNTVAASAPLAPGTEAEVITSFIPLVSTVCESDYTKKIKPGTGTDFLSNQAKEFSIISDSTPGAKKLEITSIIADAAVADVPDWVGKKPPVDGDWVQTFDEEFNGPTIDYSKWNIYGHNYWDKRSHFSKDNLILKDGTAIFHYEKKPGFHNDDPNDKETGNTPYATGFLNTFGKWTQRYGYFESRMKLPHAQGLWPAFWMMPDRGHTTYTGHYRVGTTLQPGVDPGNGGMEFDIMEFLSAWGPYRYNIAMIWDGYGKIMKETGSTRNYVQADKDGYITSGMLWTPGSAIFYCNGKEVLRWENERVSSEQEYIMYDMVSGGWEHAQLDDSKLPDDFTIDYCRVWQRKDLATPEDGPKPNKGDPNEAKN
jgi:beta-glucanase (GH16 family)